MSEFEVGHPIHVEKCEKPTLEEIMHVQKMYIEELTRYLDPCLCLSSPTSDWNGIIYCRIWNTYKDEFAKSRTRELNIVD